MFYTHTHTHTCSRYFLITNEIVSLLKSNSSLWFLLIHLYKSMTRPALFNISYTPDTLLNILYALTCRILINSLCNRNNCPNFYIDELNDRNVEVIAQDHTTGRAEIHTRYSGC